MSSFWSSTASASRGRRTGPGAFSKFRSGSPLDPRRGRSEDPDCLTGGIKIDEVSDGEAEKAEQIRLWRWATWMVILLVVVLVRLLGGRGGAGMRPRATASAYTGHDLPNLESSGREELEPNSAEFRRTPSIYGVRPTSTPRPVTPAPTRPPVQRTPRPTRNPGAPFWARMAGSSCRRRPSTVTSSGISGRSIFRWRRSRWPALIRKITEIEVAKVGDVLRRTS